MKYAIGVDVGGQSVRAALADSEGNILTTSRRPTIRDAPTARENVQLIVESIDQCLESMELQRTNLAALAVGVPGMTDTRSGLVLDAPNVPYWRNLPLQQQLTEILPIPVLLDNDVNMAAVGEHWKGSARDCSDFFFIAIGTAIGGGVFINGKIYRGNRYGAGEIGYMILHPQQSERRMEGLGWLESIASGLFIQERGRELVRSFPEGVLAGLAGSPDRLKPETVFEAARLGDQPAAALVEEIIQLLALTIVNITSILDPDLIVIGGGVASQGARLLEPIRQRAEGYGLKVPPIVQSDLEDRAQLYGAVRSAIDLLAGCEGEQT